MNDNAMTAEQAFARLQTWFQQQTELKELKQAEHLARVAVSEFYFPHPEEGTNRFDIGLGFDLKLQHSFNYGVDEAALEQVKAGDIKRLKLPWDDLFVYSPKLSVKVYRELTPEQKKFVDALLDIKPGSPQLAIVPRAEVAEAAKAAQFPAQADVDPAQLSIAETLTHIVTDAEQAQPGQYYNDGSTWWQLTDDFEWSEVEDGATIGTLAAQLLQIQSAAIAKPAKKTRGKK